jgi:ATP-dependent protease ClpP protease subunit
VTRGRLVPAADGAQNNARPTGRSWYRIVNQADDPTAAEIYVYDEIGYWGITAGAFIDELRAIASDRIDLHLNSPGGDVFDGIAILNALRAHQAEVTVYVDAIAASIASVIAMAGDRVVMARNSQMMIHDAFGLCIGDADEMRQMAETLDRHSDNIASVYNDRAGGGVKSWRARMRAESWFSPDEAVATGLADEVAAPPKRSEDMPENRWDLSIFTYAGRDQAPAPTPLGGVFPDKPAPAPGGGVASPAAASVGSPPRAGQPGGDPTPRAPSGAGYGGEPSAAGAPAGAAPVPGPESDDEPFELPDDLDIGARIRASLEQAAADPAYDPSAIAAGIEARANSAPAPTPTAPRPTAPATHVDIDTFTNALKEALQ